MSVVSGVALCARHDSLEKTTGCDAAVSLVPSLFNLILSSLVQWNYMHMIKSAEYGFQPAALVYSLPRALCLWSLVFLTAQVIFLTWSLINPIVAIAWTIMVALMLLGAVHVVFPEDTCPRTQTLEALALSTQKWVQFILRSERY